MREVDFDIYSSRLLCWLDPVVILNSSLQISNCNKYEIPQTFVVIASGILTSDRDGGFVELAKEFLNRFIIPTETLDFLRPFSTISSDNVWNELRNYKFNGSLTVLDSNFVSEPSLPPGSNPILLIEEKDYFVDIIMQPLNTLLGIVSSSIWLELSQIMNKPDVFLKHNSPEPFGAWMDATLARYFGFPNISDPKIKFWQNSPNNGYRYSSLVGWNPDDPNAEKIVKVIQDVEKERAKETHSPTISTMLRQL